MKPINFSLWIVSLITVFWSCAPASVPFSQVVDTSSKPIDHQHKMIYAFKDQNLTFSNDFDGARLNEVKQINDSVYRLHFRPENSSCKMQNFSKY